MNIHTPIEIKDIKIGLDKTKIKIALIQLKSSVQEKELIKADDGSTAYQWKATANTEARKMKVLGMLDWLKTNEPDVDIVIFPEYSFPINQTLAEIKKKVDNYNFIVIAGSDSFSDPETKQIYNKSPIVIPNSETEWIFKREPSQWESSFLNSPELTTLQRFVWEVDGQLFWFLVYICLDYLNHSIDDVGFNNLKGPGLFITPMCSPVLDDFFLFAATNLRRPGGTATLFCNCIGELAGGNSSVCAIHPGTKKFEPVFRLPKNSESIAIFDVDLTQLFQPRVSTFTTSSPIINPRIIKLNIGNDGLINSSKMREIDPKITVRGVINPALYELAGKRMRIAFLGVQKYASTKEKVFDQSFETLAVLGPSDLIITHVHQYKQNMVSEITKSAGIILRSEELNVAHQINNTDLFDGRDSNYIPFFEVENYYKVLGVVLEKNKIQISRIPKPEDLSNIVKLGKNWYDPKINDEFREKCLKNRWIIDKTDRNPGEISAVITVFLGDRSDNLPRRLREFEHRILPKIINDGAVTSCFGGTGNLLNCDFLLRVTTRVDRLFDFIEELHQWSEDSFETITTRTFVVVNKLSGLILDRVLKTQSLPPNRDAYAQKFFLPFLTDENRLKFETLPLLQQAEILDNYESTEQKLLEINKIPKSAEPNLWSRDRIKKNLSNGLLNFFYSPINPEEKEDGFTELKEVHDYLEFKVETFLKTFIEDKILINVFEELKPEVGIQSNRKKKELSYTDQVKLCIRYAKQFDSEMEILEDFQSLYETTKRRNIFAHAKITELEDAGINEYTDTLSRYLAFLEKRWR